MSALARVAREVIETSKAYLATVGDKGVVNQHGFRCKRPTTCDYVQSRCVNLRLGRPSLYILVGPVRYNCWETEFLRGHSIFLETCC